MKRHPVVWFYMLAFALSWAGWLPLVAGSRGITPFTHPVFQFLLILPAVGPALAALLVRREILGKGRVGNWFRSLWKLRGQGRWLVLAAVFSVLFLALGRIITQVMNLPVVGEPPAGNKIALGLGTLIMALLSNPWEEVGWRGFALPHLQARYTAAMSTLTVGVLWGLWHLPLFFWVNNPMSQYPFAIWFIGLVGSAFVYTWLYNSSQGSVAVVTVYHVLGNALAPWIPGVSVVALAAVNVAAAALLLLLLGGEHLAFRERVRALD